MTRHVALIPSPSEVCPHCRALAPLIERQAAVHRQAEALVGPMRDLQLALRAVEREYKRLNDLLFRAQSEHPHCAACGGRAGPGHAVESLVLEVYGPDLVCGPCKDVLAQRKESARQSVRGRMVEDREERREA